MQGVKPPILPQLTQPTGSRWPCKHGKVDPMAATITPETVQQERLWKLVNTTNTMAPPALSGLVFDSEANKEKAIILRNPSD